jgi:hypothetical protein
MLDADHTVPGFTVNSLLTITIEKQDILTLGHCRDFGRIIKRSGLPSFAMYSSHVRYARICFDSRRSQELCTFPVISHQWVLRGVFPLPVFFRNRC